MSLINVVTRQLGLKLLIEEKYRDQKHLKKSVHGAVELVGPRHGAVFSHCRFYMDFFSVNF